jgi:predicted acyltransferase
MDQKPERFLALDVFRGMTIVFMIIVNNPGSATAYVPLDHAAWFGFTPTDLVFPSFLFAVGNAMSFSMRKFDTISDWEYIWKVFKRGATIFLLGYLMYWFESLSHGTNGWSISSIGQNRIMGVLQRIGLCYFFASLLIRFLPKRGVIIASVVLLLGYWALLLIFGDAGNPYGMLTNAGTHLDKFLLGDAHLYNGEGVAFDPEGILSTLPAIVNVVIGYYAGKFIQEKGKNYEALAKMLLMGVLLIFIALCWNMTFPIAKKLWTSSFVLLTTGLDLLLISSLVYLIDIREWRYGNWPAFFNTVGKNPLPIYILSEIMGSINDIIGSFLPHGFNFFSWTNSAIFQWIAPGAFGSLLFSLFYMMICWCFGKFLEVKKIYIRV